MTNKFKYDIVTLIELIENNPCLWDKTADSFKDRFQRQKAWHSICVALEYKFEEMDRREQLEIRQLIQNKWQNLRDTFVRTVRKQSGQGPMVKYVHAENLKFLLKISGPEESESSTLDSELESRRPENEELSLSNIEEEERISEACQAPDQSVDARGKKRSWTQEEIDQRISKVLKKDKLDEDDAFFMSIIPSVKRMNEIDKLDFKMGVLGLIRNIKRQNINQTSSTGNCSSSSETHARQPYHVLIPGQPLMNLSPQSQQYNNLDVEQCDRKEDIFGSDFQ